MNESWMLTRAVDRLRNEKGVQYSKRDCILMADHFFELCLCLRYFDLSNLYLSTFNKDELIQMETYSDLCQMNVWLLIHGEEKILTGL